MGDEMDTGHGDPHYLDDEFSKDLRACQDILGHLYSDFMEFIHREGFNEHSSPPGLDQLIQDLRTIGEKAGYGQHEPFNEMLGLLNELKQELSQFGPYQLAIIVSTTVAVLTKTGFIWSISEESTKPLCLAVCIWFRDRITAAVPKSTADSNFSLLLTGVLDGAILTWEQGRANT